MRKIVSFLAAKYIYIILLLLFISHLPFLNADPDSLADINTRGAWTDEGLYTSQIRNWINHYPFSMTENTVFVRGPLYNIIQIPFFAIFGTKLIVSRLITLMIIMISVFMLTRIKEAKTTALMLIFTTFTQFHIYQFSHYGLSEMECICYVMLSMFFLVKYYERIENGKWRMENWELRTTSRAHNALPSI